MTTTEAHASGSSRTLEAESVARHGDRNLVRDGAVEAPEGSGRRTKQPCSSSFLAPAEAGSSR